MNPATLASVALVHYPVYDKQGRVVSTALTNLDLHDIARSVRTYQLANYYIVHPVAAQRELASSIMKHWETGGATQNNFRRQALERIAVVATLSEAVDNIRQRTGNAPKLVVTSAKSTPLGGQAIPYQSDMLPKCPILLIFGTGWGLAEEIMAKADFRLPPVAAHSDYNHLSVRSACAIILDRLYGDRQDGPPFAETKTESR